MDSLTLSTCSRVLTYYTWNAPHCLSSPLGSGLYTRSACGTPHRHRCGLQWDRCRAPHVLSLCANSSKGRRLPFWSSVSHVLLDPAPSNRPSYKESFPLQEATRGITFLAEWFSVTFTKTGMVWLHLPDCPRQTSTLKNSNPSSLMKIL